MESTHYETLGVLENATAEEIKAGWRAIAFENHPDRNGGKESDEFKAAAEAWTVLSDPGKRRSYDSQLFSRDATLVNGVRASGDHPFQGDVFNVLFEEMAKMRSFFGDEGPVGTGGTSYVKPHAILKTVTIPLADAFSRPDIEVPIRRWRVDHGRRIDEDAVIMVQVPVIDANGCGTVTVTGEGHAVSVRAKGDVKIAFRVRLDDGVVLRGDGGVECVWNITLRDALVGFNMTFDHPCGKQYAVSSKDAVVPPGHKHVLPGLGLERPHGGKGDFVLVFNIVFPSSIPDELKAAVQQWL